MSAELGIGRSPLSVCDRSGAAGETVEGTADPATGRVAEGEVAEVGLRRQRSTKTKMFQKDFPSLGAKGPQ